MLDVPLSHKKQGFALIDPHDSRRPQFGFHGQSIQTIAWESGLSEAVPADTRINEQGQDCTCGGHPVMTPEHSGHTELQSQTSEARCGLNIWLCFMERTNRPVPALFRRSRWRTSQAGQKQTCNRLLSRSIRSERYSG
jgi:hypothetical protein